ncbi:MAG: ribose 5-phosphate isomerase B [Planctomycetia bacterium]|nr:ribose 5-phosphate isomerase B [Planctomycetia bacterium]
MRIAIGADHRGFALKAALCDLLRKTRHEVEDVGTHSTESCDYPDYAAAVARRVSSGQAERGILVCGSALGMAIAANKIAGIRAAPCHDETTTRLSRQHNDANVLCLSADSTFPDEAARLALLWLETAFDGGRHARRVEKIRQLECSPGESK